MFHIALYEPEIAPNTGNIIRLCANNGCELHLIEPLGFDLEEKKLRRAGLDYGDLTRVNRYPDFPRFLAAMAGKRILACTTKG
ncbi:MAG: TrmH family RNA methyltransferase, partial [Shewanella indica]